MNVSGRTLTVNREQMLNNLREARAVFEATYAKAVIGWREEVAASVNAHQKALDEFGKCVPNLDPHGKDSYAIFEKVTPNFPTPPQNHLGAYDRAIRMFEQEVAEEVELTGHEINAYVHDEWSWSKMALATNRAYAAKAP